MVPIDGPIEDLDHEEYESDSDDESKQKHPARAAASKSKGKRPNLKKSGGFITEVEEESKQKKTMAETSSKPTMTTKRPTIA